MASIRKLYCKGQPRRLVLRPWFCAYPGHLEVAQHTTALAAHDASISDLSRSRVAVHLRQLELGLGANSGRECGIADYITEGLSEDRVSKMAQLERGEASPPAERAVQSVRALGEWEEFAHLSVSCCSNTLRFVWSRRVRTLTKQPRSSFFARNIDMLGNWGWQCGLLLAWRCCAQAQLRLRPIFGIAEEIPDVPHQELELKASRGSSKSSN